MFWEADVLPLNYSRPVQNSLSKYRERVSHVVSQHKTGFGNILKPDAINSALYAPSIALGGVEDMGSRRSRGLLAGVALSAGRADACLAQRLRVVRPGPVVVGDSVAW